MKKEFLDVDDMQMNNSRVLDILQQLEAVNVDTKLLKSTKIGKVVNKLRSNTKINSISEMCSRLIAKWKAAARREASSTTAPKVKTEVPRQRPQLRQKFLRQRPQLRRKILLR